MNVPEYTDIIVRMNIDPGNSTDPKSMHAELLDISHAKMIKYDMIWFIYSDFFEAQHFNYLDRELATIIIERYKR